MNKIVHEHVPASALPESLRGNIDAGATVTVTVQEETAHAPLTLAELQSRLAAARQGRPGVTTEEAVARIRALRDEWDD